MAEETLQLASLERRFAGRAIDVLITVAMMLPVIVISGVHEDLTAQKTLTLEDFLIIFFLYYVLFLAVNGYLLATQGQTVGKRIVGTRIVDHDGQILPFTRVFLMRYLIIDAFGQIPFLGTMVAMADTLFIFRGDRRCLHDHLAGSVVVMVKQES